MKLPEIGFSEIIILAIYIVATHYFVKARVREEFTELKKSVSDLDDRFDKRCDEQEYYLRRLEAVTEYNKRLSENNSDLLENSAKIKDIIEQVNKINEGEKNDSI